MSKALESLPRLCCYYKSEFAAAAARNSLAHSFARVVALSGSGLNYFSSINQRLNYYYQINSCAPEGVWGRSESPLKSIIINKFRLNARTSSHNGLRKKSSTRGKGHALSYRASPLSKQSTGLFWNSPLAERTTYGDSADCGQRRGLCLSPNCP